MRGIDMPHTIPNVLVTTDWVAQHARDAGVRASGSDMFPHWIRDAWRQLHRFSTGGNYINFQTGAEDEERMPATSGANFDRVVEVKRKIRPTQPVSRQPQYARRVDSGIHAAITVV
jgi:hypothetical protein